MSSGSILPSDDQAFQFCVMLQAGLPSSEAIRYFVESDDPGELATLLRKWRHCAAVQRAQKKLQGKSWIDMSLEEKLRAGLDMAYASMAFVLYSTNYSEATSQEKAKLDTARQAIEAKLAGTAGSQDPMSRFLADLQAGKFASITSPKPN